MAKAFWLHSLQALSTGALGLLHPGSGNVIPALALQHPQEGCRSFMFGPEKTWGQWGQLTLL